MLFKFKFIINSYSQQFYFIRTGNNFAVNTKSKGCYIFKSKTTNWNLHALVFIELILNQSNTFQWSHLTHFRPMIHLQINQLVGFY